MSNVDRRVNGFMNEEEGGSRVHSLGGEQHCCLLETGRRCSRLAGNASYSKRIQKTVAQRKLKLSLDQNSPHIYICEFHKSMIQTVRVKRKRRESEESGETDTNMSDTPDVDLFQLQMNTLRRYKKHFKVTSRPGINKTQLADSLTRSKLDREKPDTPADTD